MNWRDASHLKLINIHEMTLRSLADSREKLERAFLRIAALEDSLDGMVSHAQCMKVRYKSVEDRVQAALDIQEAQALLQEAKKK